MKKVLALVLALAMCMSFLTACGGEGGNSDPKSNVSGVNSEEKEGGENSNDGKRTKVTAAINSLDTLDPFSNAAGITANYPLYETLFTMSTDGSTLQGVMAKEWKMDENGMDIEIYDYIYDSEGNHITADDVVFSINSGLNGSQGYMSRYFESIEKTGEFSIRYNMTQQPYDSLIGSLNFYIVSEAAYTAEGADFVNKPVGTGHYTVSEFAPANKVVYEKRDSHWQSDVDESLVPEVYKANADVVELDVILETPQIQNGLETGILQCGAVNATIASSFETNDAISVTQKNGKYNHCLTLNCYQGLLAENENLRMAVLYAIDTAAIAKAVTNGTGHQSYAEADESTAGYQSSWESEDYFDYDLEKAKDYMAKAGYPDGGITLEWLGKSEEAVELTSTIIQAQLAEIGITLKISNLDNASYMSNRPAYNYAWDLCWSDGVPRGNYMQGMTSMIDNRSYSDGNQFGLNDDKLQELFLTALYDESAENIDALHQYLKTTGGICGLYTDYDFWGHDANLTIVTGSDGEIAVNAFVLGDDYNVFAD